MPIAHHDETGFLRVHRDLKQEEYPFSVDRSACDDIKGPYAPARWRVGATDLFLFLP